RRRGRGRGRGHPRREVGRAPARLRRGPGRRLGHGRGAPRVPRQGLRQVAAPRRPGAHRRGAPDVGRQGRQEGHPQVVRGGADRRGVGVLCVVVSGGSPRYAGVTTANRTASRARVGFPWSTRAPHDVLIVGSAGSPAYRGGPAAPTPAYPSERRRLTPEAVAASPRTPPAR